VRPAPGLVPVSVSARLATSPTVGQRALTRAVVVDAPADESLDGADEPADAGDSPALLLAEQLARRGVAVDVLARADVLPDVVPDVWPAVLPLQARQRQTTPATGPRLDRGLPLKPPTGSPDLVIGLTGLDGDAESAVRLAKRCRARLVLVVRGLRHAPSATIDEGLRRADQVIVPSESFRQVVRARGVGADRISVLATWTQPAPGVLDRSEARRRLGWPARSFIAVHPGAMTPDHDLENLLAAATMLGPDSLVALTGDGAARARLAEQAQRLPNVLVPATLDAEHRALSLVAADVLLVSEPAVATRLAAPVELARCLSAGRPVVATAPLAGTVAAELARTDGAGLVVPPGEPARLAGALLALHADPTHRIAMGLSAIAYAEARLSPAIMAAGLDLVMDAALG
jgi:glycosyltransferase involved in cell wall biosynthesis